MFLMGYLLMDEKAFLSVFDPKVSEGQIFNDLNELKSRGDEENKALLCVHSDPYDACKDAHAVAILTEWDEFRNYDWKMIYDCMKKPAFIFDGRNVLDKKSLEKVGFIYKGIGKS